MDEDASKGHEAAESAGDESPAAEARVALSAPDAEGFRAFLVLPGREADLRRRVGQLARRAARCGVPAPEVVWGGMVQVPGGFRGTFVERVAVKIREVEVKIAGWRHVATLELLEQGNVVREVPGQICPELYRTQAPACDHCRTDRRRSETFVFRHEDGRTAQVGRQCLVEFMGCPSAAYWAELSSLEWLVGDSEGDSEGGMGGGGEIRVATRAFLEVCCASVRQSGYLSAKAAEGQGGATTAELVWRHFTSGKRKDRIEILPLDAARADAILAWTKGLSTTNSYEHNVRLLCGEDALPRRAAGYVASAIAAFDRAQGLVLARAGRPASEHVGRVGQRGLFLVRVVAAVGIESDFGSAVLYVLRGPQNELVAWKSSGTETLDRQSSYVLRGTVKAHSFYKDEKQTQLSRCTIEVDLGPHAERSAYSALLGARDEAVVGALATFAGSKETAKTLRAVREQVAAAQAAYLAAKAGLETEVLTPAPSAV